MAWFADTVDRARAKRHRCCARSIEPIIASDWRRPVVVERSWNAVGEPRVGRVDPVRKAMSICLVVLALALLSFALRSSDDLAGSPLTEDGTQRTNGFQPAFTVVTAVAFIGSGSVETSLRIVLLLHWLVFIATAYVIGLIARDLFGRDTDDGRLAQLLAPVLFLSGLFTIQVGFTDMARRLYPATKIARRWWLRSSTRSPYGRNHNPTRSIHNRGLLHGRCAPQLCVGAIVS